MPSTQELKDISSQVRRDILRMTNGAKSGHPGGSLGCTDFIVAIYNTIMKHAPQNFTMNGNGEDVFFVSNGHISPAWYSVLARCGYLPVEELATFRKLHSRLQGHPTTVEKLPGIRMASGSLGQGLSVAIGAALSKKMNEDKNYVYCLLGDGELQEGQIWEAAMAAVKFKTDNLIATVDYNGKQIDGSLEDVMPLGDLKAKWQAFGWEVLLMDGNDMEQVVKTIKFAQFKANNGKPIMILMKTEMGMGVDFMMGTHKWHGVPPNDEQLEIALSQLEETLGDY